MTRKAVLSADLGVISSLKALVVLERERPCARQASGSILQSRSIQVHFGQIVTWLAANITLLAKMQWQFYIFFIWVPEYPFFTNRFRCDFSRVATELRLDYAMIWRSWALSFQRWFSQWHQVSHFRTFFRQQKWYSQYLCMLSCYVCRKTEEV